MSDLGTTAFAVTDLPGTEDHPHARIVLSGGLRSGSPSHAYLFHGPGGTGKAQVARELAAELLAAGSSDVESARRRALAGVHPDLTWVRPTGAHVMRVDDIAEPVVVAAAKTPFESRRRAFVLERVDTMNDEVANRLLKTLEEPADFVHLILITDSLGRVLETVRSRCQLVRFDPLPAGRLATQLEIEGVEPERARACARLALGSGTRARLLASEEGERIRADAEGIVGAAIAGPGAVVVGQEPWRGLLERAEERKSAVEQDAATREADLIELAPEGRDRRAVERELGEAAKRDGRRARTEVLELGLTLVAAGFRDLVCLAEEAPEAVLASDRLDLLAELGADGDARRLREAIERSDDVRSALQLNVSEELALETLSFRLSRLVGAVA